MRLGVPRWPWLIPPTIAILIITVAVQIWSAFNRQLGAIRHVRRAGGRVVIEPGGPAWLRARVGDQWMAAFDEVVEVNLDGGEFDDTAVSGLQAFQRLRVLNLSGTQITDVGLARVGKRDFLETLRLSSTRVTDVGAQCLERMPLLSYLDLGDTRITDASLAQIAGLIAACCG